MLKHVLILLMICLPVFAEDSKPTVTLETISGVVIYGALYGVTASTTFFSGKMAKEGFITLARALSERKISLSTIARNAGTSFGISLAFGLAAALCYISTNYMPYPNPFNNS